MLALIRSACLSLIFCRLNEINSLGRSSRFNPPLGNLDLLIASEDSCNPIILRVHPSDFFSHPTEYVHPLLADVAWDCCFDPPVQDSRSLEATKDPFAADGDAVCLDVGRGLVQ